MRPMGDWNWWAPDWVTRVVRRVGLGHAEVAPSHGASSRMVAQTGD